MSVFHDIGREAAILINVNQKFAMTKTALSPMTIAKVLGKAGPGSARRVQAIVQRMGGDKAIANSAKSMQAIAKPGYSDALALRNARQATNSLQRQYSPGAISPSRVLSEAEQVKNMRNLARPINQPNFGPPAIAPQDEIENLLAFARQQRSPAGLRPAPGANWASAAGARPPSPAASVGAQSVPGANWASASRSAGPAPSPAVPGANWASASRGSGPSPAASVGASSAAPVPSPAASVGAQSAVPPTALPIPPRPIPLGNAPPHAAPAPGAGLGQTLGKGLDSAFSGGGNFLGKALKLPFSAGMPIERRFLAAGGLGVAGAGINDALAFAADKTGLPIPHLGDWDPSKVKGLAKQEPWTTGLMHPLQYLASKNAPDAAPFRPAGPRGQMPSGMEFKNPTFDPTTGKWTATPSGKIEMEMSPEVANAHAQYRQSGDLLKQHGIPLPGQGTNSQQSPGPNMDHYRWSPPSMYATPNRSLVNNVY